MALFEPLVRLLFIAVCMSQKRAQKFGIVYEIENLEQNIDSFHSVLS
jgi:hypothetical protein